MGEAWLYGSHARGDSDELSDLDVMVVGNVPQEALAVVRRERGSFEPTEYSWPEFEHMVAYGSLFLYHLAVEGRLLWPLDGPSYIAERLKELPRYARARRELNSFFRVLDDVRLSVEGDHSPSYELSVIATCLRHASILGCYAAGRATFGREAAFDVFLGVEGFAPTLVAGIKQLYKFRMYEDGRTEAPFQADTAAVRYWLDVAEGILHRVERRLDALEARTASPDRAGPRGSR